MVRGGSGWIFEAICFPKSDWALAQADQKGEGVTIPGVYQHCGDVALRDSVIGHSGVGWGWAWGP